MFSELMNYFVYYIRSFFIEEAEFLTDDIISIPYYWCGDKYYFYAPYKSDNNIDKKINVFINKNGNIFEITQQPGIPYFELGQDNYIIRVNNEDIISYDVNNDLLKYDIDFYND